MNKNKTSSNESSMYYTVLAILILVLVAGITYVLYFKKEQSYKKTTTDEGFTYKSSSTKKSKTDKTSKSSDDIIIDTILSPSKRKIPGKHKFSHVEAVRSLSNFTWDDSSYYQETIKPLEPMAKSLYDTFYEEKIKPLVENSNLNPVMLSLIEQAEKHPRYLEAINLFKNGRYKEAVEIFTNLAQHTTNLYLKSAALGYLQEIYRVCGDKEQEKKAQAALIINNAKLYFKAFPGSEKVITLGQPPESKDVIKRLLAENPKLDFKPPKKTVDF